MEASPNLKLDEIDRGILKEIQKNSRISNNELARRVNLSQPATHARLKRLQEQQVIRGFSVNLDFEKLGYELTCFFQTRLQDHSEQAVVDFEQKVNAFPEVLECHYLTGEFDHLIKAVFKNRRELERFMRNRLSVIPGVAQIITSLVLSEVKSGGPLTIE